MAAQSKSRPLGLLSVVPLYITLLGIDLFAFFSAELLILAVKVALNLDARMSIIGTMMIEKKDRPYLKDDLLGEELLLCYLTRIVAQFDT